MKSMFGCLKECKCSILISFLTDEEPHTWNVLQDFCFTVFSLHLHFSSISHFSDICSDALCRPPEGKAKYLQRTQSLPAFKGLFFHSSQKVEVLWSSCISLVTDNVLMWGSKIYLQNSLVWYYLLGDQNSLDAFCSQLCLQNTYCFLLSFPSGRKGCELASLWLLKKEH